MTRPPTRASWSEACRAAAAEPGVWQRAGDGGPFWMVAPAEADTRRPVTVHGLAGDVGTTVDGSRLRAQAVAELDPDEMSGVELAGMSVLLGRIVKPVARQRLHARTPERWPWTWAEGWDALPQDPDRGGPMPHSLDWRYTRWRGRLLLIVWGGERAARAWAPDGTIATVWTDDVVTVQPLTAWDRATSVLLEAAAAGEPLLEAAAAALTYVEGDG